MLEGSLGRERLGGEENPSLGPTPSALGSRTLQAIEDPYCQARYCLTIESDSELSPSETLYQSLSSVTQNFHPIHIKQNTRVRPREKRYPQAVETL